MTPAAKIPSPALEADSNFEQDSEYSNFSYATGPEGDTASLISAARNHVFENGRRYHGYKEARSSRGKYFLPNDELEQDRLDLFHHCYLIALRGELFTYPLGKDSIPKRILDVGTGTGIWAIEIADQFPSADVLGVDLSPIQPNFIPPNLAFEVDDIEEAWQYQDNSFDFIHIRTMAGYIRDWPKLYRQAFKALRPGGWIEVQDIVGAFSADDDTWSPDNVIGKWTKYWEESVVKSGHDWSTVAPETANSLKDVGCVDVTEKVINFPIGGWAKGKTEKELGIYWRQCLIDGAEALSLPFTRNLGWGMTEVEKFVADLEPELMNPTCRTYSKFYYIYGRKPVE
ncbi:hypothetical protein RUND412_005919 [Rhizina undulata]